MNGANLADWQLVYNAINERYRAICSLSTYRNENQNPVPESGFVPYGDSHSRSILPNLPSRYLDPTNPVKILTPSDSDWPYYYDSTITGEVVVAGPWLDTGSYSNIFYNNRKYIYEYYPGFHYASGHIEDVFGEWFTSPGNGTPIANLGTFLDERFNAAHKMYKASTDIQESCSDLIYRSNISWNLTTGEVYDNVLGELLSGVTFSDYSDCYNYAYLNLHVLAGNTFGTLGATVNINHNDWTGDETITVYISFDRLNINPVGSITSDLTFYYETTGDNLGIPVTSSEYVKSYSSANFNAITYGGGAEFGFSPSAFSVAPTLPALNSSTTLHESLIPQFLLWDFSNYFEY